MFSLALAWHRAEQAWQAKQTPGGPQTIDKCVYITPVPTENDGQAARLPACQPVRGSDCGCGAGVREWAGVELVCQRPTSNVFIQCKKCPPSHSMIHGLAHAHAHAQAIPLPCLHATATSGGGMFLRGFWEAGQRGRLGCVS
jgi:hypothetical protein